MTIDEITSVTTNRLIMYEVLAFYDLLFSEDGAWKVFSEEGGVSSSNFADAVT
jgi:hypothetical protein